MEESGDQYHLSEYEKARAVMCVHSQLSLHRQPTGSQGYTKHARSLQNSSEQGKARGNRGACGSTGAELVDWVRPP